MKLGKAFAAVCVAALPALYGCAATEVLSSWKDPGFRPDEINKVITVGVFRGETTRHTFEDRLAGGLSTKGLDALPGYQVVGDSLMGKKEMIDAVRAAGADAILITRVVDRHVIETYYPPETTYVGPLWYHRDWYGYYYDSFNYITTPGYVERQKVLELETSLYNTVSGELEWSALSETYYEGPTAEEIAGVVDALIEKMESEGVVR